MLTALLLVSAATTAAPPPKVEIGGSQLVKAVQNCQSIKENDARLACYDRAAAALVSATASGDVTIVDRGQVRQVRRSLFGFSIGSLPFFSGSKNAEADAEPKELKSTMASFQPIANGFFRITLTDPQSTWESTEPSDVFDPKHGAAVTISHGALGSYWAEISGQPAVKVRRIH
jgi:hypothetical protein